MLKQNNLNLVIKILLGTSIFFIFSQLNIYFWPNFSFINGSKIDYLSPSIYFFETPLFILLIIFSFKFFKINKKILLILFFVFLNILFSNNIFFTFFSYIKLLTKIVFVYFLTKNYLNTKQIINIFIYSFFFVCLVSFLQIFNQHSFYNFFYIFGERKFSVNTIGISTVNIFNHNFIRPMATFPHANVLSAYLVVFFTLLLDKKDHRVFFTVCSAMLIVIMFFTNSNAIILSFLLSLVFLNLPNYFFWILPFISTVSIPFFVNLLNYKFSLDIFERMYLNITSLYFIKIYFYFGVGYMNYLFKFNDYTFFINNNFNLNLNRFWIQPVHNIYLLIFSEAGILGLVLFCLFISQVLKKAKNNLKIAFLFILISGLFDHFWISLMQGQMLFFLIIALILKKNFAKIKNNEKDKNLL